VRAAILRRLREASAYPEEVREARVEGTVTVRFRVATDGSVAAVETLRPSRSPLLDAASHDWVRRAAPYPVFSGWITVPLTFRLDEAETR
jgi:TonB family protein